MSLTVTGRVLQLTTHSALADYREDSANSDRDWTIDTNALDRAALEDIAKAADESDDGKTARAIGAILAAREGTFDAPIPNFKAFQSVLESFLKHKMTDGWIYVEEPDGKLYPQLITGITFDDGDTNYGRRRSKSMPSVTIHTAYYGISRGEQKISGATHGYMFTPQDVSRRRIADVLAREGIYKETPALRADYDASLKRHREMTEKAFARQFRFTGKVYHNPEGRLGRDRVEVVNRKVIHDLDADDYGGFERYVDSDLFAKNGNDGIGAVPEHPLVRVFDLKTHEFYWVHGDYLSTYEYDKSLRDKLILPPSHRDLLDVLTTDVGAFVDDIIEGKSAGNIILCKGIAGVGKTLTAEVYAELTERPLYSIHSGQLGTTASDIDENLAEIFVRAKRWNCVLLLDEADVFVLQRGQNVEQNAIVAEFLRVMEYFDGLFFMTTNRPDDIDDAILSRCAAIIEYDLPDSDRTAHVWRVMSDQFKAEMSDTLIVELVAAFNKITPRDIKMLLRLALRVSQSQRQVLSLDVFRRCAMFRAIPMTSAVTEVA